MCEYIGTQGWTVPWTNLNLYGALVRSNLLFGAPAWAPKHLLANHGASDPQLRTLEAFHRHCLRTLLALPSETRNCVTYITANTHPLHVSLAKAVWRYFRRIQDLSITPNSPPIGAIVRWLRQLSSPDPYTVFVGIKVSHSMLSEKDFYTNLFGQLKAEIRSSARLALPGA